MKPLSSRRLQTRLRLARQHFFSPQAQTRDALLHGLFLPACRAPFTVLAANEQTLRGMQMAWAECQRLNDRPLPPLYVQSRGGGVFQVTLGDIHES